MTAAVEQQAGFQIAAVTLNVLAVVLAILSGPPAFIFAAMAGAVLGSSPVLPDCLRVATPLRVRER